MAWRWAWGRLLWRERAAGTGFEIRNPMRGTSPRCVEGPGTPIARSKLFTCGEAESLIGKNSSEFDPVTAKVDQYTTSFLQQIQAHFFFFLGKAMKLKTTLTAFGAFAAATAMAMSAQAADIGLDFNPNPAATSISAYLNGDFTVRWAFEDEIAADVVALGTWGGQPNTYPFHGIRGTVTVALWDSSGDLLASTTVDPNSPRSGTANQWVFGAIAPVLLTPGQTYYVGSHQTTFDAQDYVFGVNPVSIAPEISYLHNAGQIGFAFPNLTLSANDEHGFFGGNVLLVAAAAPEPSSWALLLLGFGGLGATMRSRRRSEPAAAQLGFSRMRGCR